MIQSPVPYQANGGELLELDDGTIWKDVSYQYLYLYEYYPTVVVCPNQGQLIINDKVIDVEAR